MWGSCKESGERAGRLLPLDFFCTFCLGCAAPAPEALFPITWHARRWLGSWYFLLNWRDQWLKICMKNILRTIILWTIRVSNSNFVNGGVFTKCNIWWTGGFVNDHDPKIHKTWWKFQNGLVERAGITKPTSFQSITRPFVNDSDPIIHKTGDSQGHVVCEWFVHSQNWIFSPRVLRHSIPFWNAQKVWKSGCTTGTPMRNQQFFFEQIVYQSRIILRGWKCVSYVHWGPLSHCSPLQAIDARIPAQLRWQCQLHG